MSVLTEWFTRARAVLDVAPEADKSVLKRAYRKKVIEHPPDVDPEGFRQVRESYEILSNPMPAARRCLLYPMPHAAPPTIPDAQSPSEPLVFAFLRQVVASLPSEQIESQLSQTKPRKPKPS